MARKKQLRATRAGTVINTTSKKQETDVILALQRVEAHLNENFATRIALTHQKQWLLRDIVAELRRSYPHVRFHHHLTIPQSDPTVECSAFRGTPRTGCSTRYSSPRLRTKEPTTCAFARVYHGRLEVTQSNASARILSVFAPHLCARASFLSSVSGTAVTSRPLRPFWIGYRRWPCSVNLTRPTCITRTRGGLAAGASTFGLVSGQSMRWPQ